MRFFRLAITVCLLTITAKADVLSLLNSRLLGVDSIFWENQGVVEFDPLSSGTTTNGNGFTVSGTPTFLFLGSTYNADFLPTDGVLTTFDPNNGPASGGIRINFKNPIYGGGAQIQIPAFGVPFTAIVEAFGAGGVSLGTVTRTGSVNNPSLGDGSALFIGVRSNLQDIVALEFRTTDGQRSAIDGLGINNLSITGAVVPEPSTYVAVPALAGLLLAAHRRRRSAAGLRAPAVQR